MKIESYKEIVTYHDTEWCEAMAAQCATARYSIHISALSMLPPTPNATGQWPTLWREWCAAARRGVRVDIWLPAPSAIYPASLGNLSAARKIVEAGMFIHSVPGNKLLHAKTCVIDKCSVWVGSGNFTAAAAHHNHESYMQTCSELIASRIVNRLESIA
jgi:phosphatidylserine/phosphatidylglycerophosphate/cardiolipin synthase-like enzyme